MPAFFQLLPISNHSSWFSTSQGNFEAPTLSTSKWLYVCVVLVEAILVARIAAQWHEGGVSSSWFEIENPLQKIEALPSELHSLLSGRSRAAACHQRSGHLQVGRDVEVVPMHLLPPKLGLSHPSGQARLLHDLANIELQAMELAVRTLHEFPEAPVDFRSELAEIALSESRHLGLCLKGIEARGSKWGDWQVHLALWNTVAESDSLLSRILIVHRYLEGSGLDAGESILRRLAGVADKGTRDVVKIIVDEEVGHVLFGSQWYHRIATSEKVDVEKDFARRMAEISVVAPRRERIARDVRTRAGFTPFELDVLESLTAGSKHA
jgi:uncharacterized ferritin-like protein (DUF455 family)